MRVPIIRGVIRRRLLVNFRVDPCVIQRYLPAGLTPKLHNGEAIAGICLIRLEQIRPRRLPALLGISSENAAHRIAVVWRDASGAREGVYIPRRDTNSRLNSLAGGRLFPGEHHRAHFRVRDTGDRIGLRMRSSDGGVAVEVLGGVDTSLPTSSGFGTLSEASSFFEAGSLGYSATADLRRLDGILLKTEKWSVEPLNIERVSSSYFDKLNAISEGSVRFDCALVMRNIAHEWHAAEDMYVDQPAAN